MTSLRGRFIAILAVFKYNWIEAFRHTASIVFLIVLPAIFAAIPIFIGELVAGGPTVAAQNFLAQVGTANYRLYFLIGFVAWSCIIVELSEFAFWIRRQQMIGTFEHLRVTPTTYLELLGGLALWGLTIAILQASTSLLIGGAILGLLNDILSPLTIVAILVVVIGMLSVVGFSLMFSALVVRFREAQRIIQILQWVFMYAIGVFYPITLYPLILRFACYSLPVSIAIEDVRALLLGTRVVASWLLDPLIVILLGFIYVVIGYRIIQATELRVKRGEGLAAY